jgi:hypothetical protein
MLQSCPWSHEWVGSCEEQITVEEFNQVEDSWGHNVILLWLKLTKPQDLNFSTDYDKTFSHVAKIFYVRVFDINCSQS